MKDFLLDDGKVRLCTSNFAKMNILEFMWYKKEWFSEGFEFVWEQLCEGVPLVAAAIVNFACLLLAPVTFPIAAWFQIRQAKKEVEVYENSSLKRIIENDNIKK
jgi:hypothetical protein